MRYWVAIEMRLFFFCEGRLKVILILSFKVDTKKKLRKRSIVFFDIEIGLILSMKFGNYISEVICTFGMTYIFLSMNILEVFIYSIYKTISSYIGSLSKIKEFYSV